jgi:hypothetical protein
VFVELHQARQREREMEREQRHIKDLQAELEHYRNIGSSSSSLPVGEGMYGGMPLAKVARPSFDRLAEAYGRALEQSLETRALKVDHHIPEQLRVLASDLGFLGAGPRDVVELHQETLESITRELSSIKAQALIKEGRFVVLEVMGNLVSFYRKYYPRARGARDSVDGPDTSPSKIGPKEEFA